MWYKLKRIMMRPNGVEKQVYPAIRVQTFDFQNEWALGWTNNNIWYWDCSIVSWQWWQITRPQDPYAMQWWVLPPSSVYSWTLKKRKIWAYKNGDAAVGIANSSQTNSIEYGRGTNKIRINDTQIWTLSLSGEITMESIIEDNWHITLNLNSNSYDLWAYGSAYQNLWSSQNLWLELWRWSSSASIYIRKVEITTA